METWEKQHIVGLLVFFVVVGILIFSFTSYLVYLHEQTVRVCIESGQSWSNESCISMIK